jgi:hypothetical protein
MDQWHLSEQAVSSKGQKSCVLTAEHQVVRFQLGEGLRTRFGASTFDKNVDAVRRSLDFDLDDAAVLARLKEIDDWALEYLTTHSERLLKKQLSRTEVENGYTPLVRAYGSNSSCKTKINIRGSRSATFWNEKGEQILDPPADGTWQDFAYTAYVSIPQLWIMAGSFGLLLETTALLLSAPSAINPFEQKAM